jgi:hypothetical protein
MTFAAAELAAVGRAAAQPANGPGGAMPASTEPFGPSKQIDAGVLSIGYVEIGPSDGRPVILLHGWPYDIHSYAEVAPLLASAGHRVLVPCAMASRRRWPSTPSRSWMPSGFARPRLQGSIGGPGRRTSLRRYGRSAAGRWCRSVAI